MCGALSRARATRLRLSCSELPRAAGAPQPSRIKPAPRQVFRISADAPGRVRVGRAPPRRRRPPRTEILQSACSLSLLPAASRALAAPEAQVPRVAVRGVADGPRLRFCGGCERAPPLSSSAEGGAGQEVKDGAPPPIEVARVAARSARGGAGCATTVSRGDATRLKSCVSSRRARGYPVLWVGELAAPNGGQPRVEEA